MTFYQFGSHKIANFLWGGEGGTLSYKRGVFDPKTMVLRVCSLIIEFYHCSRSISNIFASRVWPINIRHRNNIICIMVSVQIMTHIIFSQWLQLSSKRPMRPLVSRICSLAKRSGILSLLLLISDWDILCFFLLKDFPPFADFGARVNKYPFEEIVFKNTRL